MVRTVQTRRVRRRRRKAPRPNAVGLLGAAVLGGVVASAGMLATAPGTTSGPLLFSASVVASAPAPASVPAEPVVRADGPAAPVTPARPAAPRTQEAEYADLVAEPKAVAFLKAMRAANLPTSRNGVAEVLTAKATCSELASGTSATNLAKRIPSGLPTVTKAQAATLVTLAEKHYC